MSVGQDPASALWQMFVLRGIMGGLWATPSTPGCSASARVRADPGAAAAGGAGTGRRGRLRRGVVAALPVELAAARRHHRLAAGRRQGRPRAAAAARHAAPRAARRQRRLRARPRRRGQSDDRHGRRAGRADRPPDPGARPQRGEGDGGPCRGARRPAPAGAQADMAVALATGTKAVPAAPARRSRRLASGSASCRITRRSSPAGSARGASSSASPGCCYRSSASPHSCWHSSGSDSCASGDRQLPGCSHLAAAMVGLDLGALDVVLVVVALSAPGLGKMAAWRTVRASPTRSRSGSSSRRGRARSASSPAVIERSGGMVTAPRRHRVRATTGCGSTSRVRPATPSTPTQIVEALRGRRGRRDRQGLRPHVPDAPRRQDRDGVQVPIRNRDDLSMVYTPGVARVCHGDRREPRGRPPADHQAQHRGGRHRRLRGARPGQHRAARRAAGDGGQGGAVQAVRRHRRLPDLPRHPGPRRDRRSIVKAIAPGLRRHQPRGHLGAPLLRDRGPAARGARHPGLPRRPARHGDRRARRADQRAAGGRQGARATSGW